MQRQVLQDGGQTRTRVFTPYSGHCREQSLSQSVSLSPRARALRACTHACHTSSRSGLPWPRLRGRSHAPSRLVRGNTTPKAGTSCVAPGDHQTPTARKIVTFNVESPKIPPLGCSSADARTCAATFNEYGVALQSTANVSVAPQSWTTDRRRCEQAKVPKTIDYRPKWQIALDEIDRMRAQVCASASC